MKKIHIGILLWVFVLAIWLAITTIISQKNNRISDLEEQFHSVSQRMWTVYTEYQVEQTESCRSIVEDVLAIRVTLDHVRWLKDTVCWALDNPPKDIINPESYYDFYWDGEANNAVVIKKENNLVAQ